MSLGNSNGGVGFRNRNRRVDPSIQTTTVNTGTPAADAKVGKVDPVTGGSGVSGGGGGKTTTDTRTATERAGFVSSKTSLNPDMYGDTALLKKPGYGVGPFGNVVHVSRRPSESTTSKTMKPKGKKSTTSNALNPTLTAGM